MNKKVLSENYQLADKLYFQSGKIPPEGQSEILDISGGDNYTKILSDIYLYVNEHMSYYSSKRILREKYSELKAYSKQHKFLPIADLGDINHVENIGVLINLLTRRNEILIELNKLPSIARRNFPERQDVHDIKWFNDIRNKLIYFMGHYSLLENRPKEVVDKINKKIFRSGYSIDDWLDFIEDKGSIFEEQPITKESLLEIIEEGDSELVYNKNNMWVVEVYSAYTMKELGCNSYWCFSYGGNLISNWSQYSTNDMVYLIIDFSEDYSSEDFMHVLIRPIDDAIENYPGPDGDSDALDDYYETYNELLYDMGNTNKDDPIGILRYMFCKDNDNCGNKLLQLFNFE